MNKVEETILVVFVAFMVVSILGVQVAVCVDFDYDYDQDLDPLGTWGNIAEIYGYYSTNPLRYGHEHHHAKAWTHWPMCVWEGNVYFDGTHGQEYHEHIEIDGRDYDESEDYDYYTGLVSTDSDAWFYNSITKEDFTSECHAAVIAGSGPR